MGFFEHENNGQIRNFCVRIRDKEGTKKPFSLFLEEMEDIGMANYRTKEAKEIMSINRNLLDSLRKAGLIKYHKIGRNYVYTDSDIEQFLDSYIGKRITKEGLVLNEG